MIKIMVVDKKESFLPYAIKLDGTGLYDSEPGKTVKVLEVHVSDGGVNARVDTTDLIYTDKGFERGMNDLAELLGLPSVAWSEQGMQYPNEGEVHFDCDVSVVIKHGPL